MSGKTGTKKEENWTENKCERWAEKYTLLKNNLFSTKNNMIILWGKKCNNGNS